MAIGKLTKDCLNIIFLLDTSGSMIGPRIDQLNYAMPEALQALKKVAISEEVDAFVRVVEFNSAANWIMGAAEAGVSIEDAANQWPKRKAGERCKKRRQHRYCRCDPAELGCASHYVSGYPQLSARGDPYHRR